MASKPCLPVSRRRKAREDAPIEFDDIASMDATEYLSRVVQQSQRLPEILHRSSQPQSSSSSNSNNNNNKHKHHVPIEGSAASLSYLVSDRTAILPPPSAAHAPTNSSEWVDATLANFSQLRLFLDTTRTRRNQQQHQHQQLRKQPVPRMQDRPAWHIFCLGEKEAHGNAGSYFADEDNEDDANDDNNDKLKSGEENGETIKDAKDNDSPIESKEPWQEELPDAVARAWG